MQTEFEFTLPRGYVDTNGTLHRELVMRLATAHDEIETLQDGRIRANALYASVLLLQRVILRLGELTSVSAEMIEGFFASDFAYLQAKYLQLNDGGEAVVETQCPACGAHLAVELLPDTTNIYG